MTAFDHLVGVPWRAFGRTLEGADCYGLVVLAYREIGIELPLYDQVNPDDAPAVRSSIAIGRSDWVKISPDAAAAHDVVLLHERPWHIGLVVRRGLMLHMPEGHSSVVEPYTTARHARRVEGIYRHASQA